MSDLVDVVADATQLREQCRVHGAVGGLSAHIDLALQHQPLAETGDRQTQVPRLRRLQRIVVVGHANADHAAARSAFVRPSSRHQNCLIRVGFGTQYAS